MNKKEWKDKIGGINDNLGNSRKNQLIKVGLPIVVVIVVASLLVFNLLGGNSQERKIPEIDQQINITKDGSHPVRPEVSPGDRVRFMNKLDQKVTVSFEGKHPDLILIPGEADSIEPETVTYYKISSKRNDFRSLKGSINVQS